MEAFHSRFKRRVITIPTVIVLGLIWILLLPLWLPLGILVDVFRSTPPVVARSGLCITHYFLMEFFGLLGCLFLWLGRLLFLVRGEQAYLNVHYTLQRLWGAGLLRGSCWLFRLDLRVEGAEHLERGPVLVFMRHVTLMDTLFPASAFGQPRGLKLRYLIKRELLLEPCLDVCGQRIPNLFVDRSGLKRDETLAKVKALATDMGAEDGVILYPEGTRFTLGKRARLIQRFREKGEEAQAEKAESLQNLLPPRYGGPLACFEGAPDADVVIVGHVGFEGAANVRHFLSGRVYNNPVIIKMWRYSRSEVPEDEAGRKAWLEARWFELDQWVSEQHVE